METLFDNMSDFINNVKWTYAKTMPEWPHEYIVRKNVDEEMFIELVEHIRKFGYEGKYYSKTIIYFDIDGYTYWTMGAPIEDTIIINRAKKENTYEERKKNGTLPENIKTNKNFIPLRVF